MKPKLTLSALILSIALAISATSLFATDDCPPFDPPTSEPTEGAEDTSALPLPIRPAPKLKTVDGEH